MSLETVSPCVVIVPIATFGDHFPPVSPPRWLATYSRCPLWRFLHMHSNNVTLVQGQRVVGHLSWCLAWPVAKVHVVCSGISVSRARPAGTLTRGTCINTDVPTSPTKMRLVHTSAGQTAVSIPRGILNQHPLTLTSLSPVALDGSRVLCRSAWGSQRHLGLPQSRKLWLRVGL